MQQTNMLYSEVNLTTVKLKKSLTFYVFNCRVGEVGNFLRFTKRVSHVGLLLGVPLTKRLAETSATVASLI